MPRVALFRNLDIGIRDQRQQMGRGVNRLLERLGMACPIIQAPMAGISTPALAAAVSNAGGLGSLGLGAAGVNTAGAMIRELKSATNRAWHANVFCHRPARTDASVEHAWLSYLKPEFEAFGAATPETLIEIYTSFLVDDDMLGLFLAERPPVLSFHFGLPSAERIAALKAAGILLVSSATSLAEGQAGVDAGMDAIIAQGYEAGGHRGVFEPAGPDERLGTMALTRLLVRRLDRPVIAAGGIMDGAGIAAVLALGAEAAQLGTAFVACPETSADQSYRDALLRPGAQTTMTAAISGRPARGVVNRFTMLGDARGNVSIPEYPIAYDAGKALIAAAKSRGEPGFGAYWAGQGAALARSLPAADLVARLRSELEQAARPRLTGRASA